MIAGSLRDEADTNFLVEYFQNLPASAALDQFTVKFQALNCLTTPNRNAQVQRLVLSRVILTGLRLRDDDMLNLRSRQGRPGSERLQGLPTWFIKTSVPAFNPAATDSSKTFSNRFFSRTTPLRKSVLSMCGAYSPFRCKCSPKNEASVPALCQSTLGPLTGSYLQYVPARRIVPGGQRVLQIPDARQA
jgi:hypothetical protein